MTRATANLLPDPCDTYEQAVRYEHGDLPGMSTKGVWSELCVVRASLARRVFYGRDRPHGLVDSEWRTECDWLRERAKRLEAELRRRS